MVYILFSILGLLFNSVSINAAPTLMYSTMVEESVSYYHSSFTSGLYAADLDAAGNMYIAVPIRQSDGGRCIRIFCVNSDGTDVTVISDIEYEGTTGVYCQCPKMICSESAIYLLINYPYVVVKLDYGGNEVFRFEWINSYLHFFVDNSDNLYLALNVESAEDAENIDVTSNAFNPCYSGGMDIVIKKYDSDGNLLYSSFLGGSNDDYVSDIRIDDKGMWYLYLYHSSVDFPCMFEGEPYHFSRPSVITISHNITGIYGYYSMSYFDQSWTRFYDDNIYESYSEELRKYSILGQFIWSMDVSDEIPRLGSNNESLSYINPVIAVEDKKSIYIIRKVTYGSPFTITSDDNIRNFL